MTIRITWVDVAVVLLLALSIGAIKQLVLPGLDASGAFELGLWSGIGCAFVMVFAERFGAKRAKSRK